jgi:hypothetical protein
MANLTLLNGLGVAGAVTATSWAQDPVLAAGFEAGAGGSSRLLGGEARHHGALVADNLVEVRVEHQEVVWPWAGYLAVHVTATSAAASFQGDVGGVLKLTVEATDEVGVTRTQVLELPIKVRVVPTPPRAKRLLWDQFHSIGYPSGYFPRDNLKVWAGERGEGGAHRVDYEGGVHDTCS